MSAKPPRESETPAPLTQPPAAASPAWGSWALLALALVSACVVYWPVLSANWFYDDADYVLGDPRLERLELFSPAHWHEKPPPIPDEGDPGKVLPGYDKPVIYDRYLWRLSFALERKLFTGYGPQHAHTVNLLLHLSCLVAAFFALRGLLRFYATEYGPFDARWQYWPALGVLMFAIHPWAAEPVCYISTRSASMATLFALLALLSWIRAWEPESRRLWRGMAFGAAALGCLAAFGSKENFLITPLAIVLTTWPVLWARARRWSPQGSVAAAIGMLLLLALVGWVGIRSSERASGLLHLATAGQGRDYLIYIQSPLVLQTLLDQIFCRRITLESNHPGWPAALAWAAFGVNTLLLFGSLFFARRWPVLLGLALFYVLLLPTNSFLPRPDFLALRNVYLPTLASCAALAGAILWLATGARLKPAAALALVLLAYWAFVSRGWAEAFAQPNPVWERSAVLAPDHATVRLNYAYALLQQGRLDQRPQREVIERELNAALSAESSPTMQYQNERPRKNRRVLAYRGLAHVRQAAQQWVEAEDALRRAWDLDANLQTWLQWAEVCSRDELRARLPQVLELGFARWPDAWWPRAMRAISRMRLQKLSAHALSTDQINDLQAAERAPNTTLAALRPLQAHALSLLVQTRAARPRAAELLERLSELGVAEEDIKTIHERLNGSR